MKTYTAVVERCADTGLFVGYVPVNRNLQEVIEMLLEDGEPECETRCVTRVCYLTQYSLRMY